MTTNSQPDVHANQEAEGGVPNTAANRTAPCQVTRASIVQTASKQLDRVFPTHETPRAVTRMGQGDFSQHRDHAKVLRAANRAAQKVARSNPSKPKPMGAISPSSTVVTQNHSQHAASSNSFSTSTPGFVLPRQDTERWLRILSHPSNGPHGAAVVALAHWLSARSLSADLVAGCELALELLGSEAPAVCENVITLVTDGWELSLGELLTCARSL